jgi:hypothetical protein
MKNHKESVAELRLAVTLYKRIDGRWVTVKRFCRYWAAGAEDDDERTSVKLACPGCKRIMSRLSLNQTHECTAGVEQPDYTPAYKIRQQQRLQERKEEWKRKSTTLAALSGIIIRETADEYVVDYSQALNLKPTGQEGLVRIVQKSAKK